MPDFQEDDEAHSRGAKLFAETIAAHGGRAFLNLKTLKATGKGEFTTPPQTGGLKIPLPSCTYYVTTEGRSRLEARSPGGPLLFVMRGNGQDGFIVLAGRTLQIPAEQIDGLEPTEFLRAAASQGYPVVADDSASEEMDDGKTLLRYDVHRSDGKTTRVFVESDTGLVRKMVTETPRGEMTVLLSAYKLVAGLPIFGEIHILENGASILKMMVSEVLLDIEIKDSLFEG